MNKWLFWIIGIICVLFTGCGRVEESKLENIVANENIFQCSFNGNDRSFALYFPESDSKEESLVPLIIMLNNYGTSYEYNQEETDLDVAANERGYMVCYVSATTGKESVNDNGWNSGIGDSEKDDLEFLVALAHYLQEQYNCSRKNTFVVGFSNAAFMTQRLAVEANEIFYGIACIAGSMPPQIYENRMSRSNVSVLQIYGTKDDVIYKESDNNGRRGDDPTIEDVLEYWIEANNVKLQESVELSENATCVKYTNNSKNRFVWNVTIEDGRHSWPHMKFAGFEATDLILDFFDQIVESGNR